MADQPDFVARVRKQLDEVCGDAKRLPTFDDHDRLPLVTACVKEALRWKPFVESGMIVPLPNLSKASCGCLSKMTISRITTSLKALDSVFSLFPNTHESLEFDDYGS